jgi:hypothetical protein
MWECGFLQLKSFLLGYLVKIEIKNDDADDNWNF